MGGTCKFCKMSGVRPSSPEVQEVDTEKAKSGRHSRFTAEEDLLIVREVCAAQAHIASFGETRTRFENAATKANENPLLRARVTWKSIQDRYKRLQETFEKGQDAQQVLSGVGGGAMGEIEELLLGMREAKDDLAGRKRANKKRQAELDEKKDRAGRELVAAASKRRERETSKDDEEEDSKEGTPRLRKVKRAGMSSGIGDDMEAFGRHLRDSDLARIELDRERLTFERERFDKDLQERERERAERKEEREHTAKVELEKFKLFMEAFSKK